MEKHFLIADPSASTSATASAHEHVPESQSQGRSPQANHMYVPPVQYELPPYYPQYEADYQPQFEADFQPQFEADFQPQCGKLYVRPLTLTPLRKNRRI
ncbi:hypothetical protein YC2023_086074 [Brassica napus]